MSQGVYNKTSVACITLNQQMKFVNQFNKLINTLKREEKETCNTDKYPWLNDSNERKHMTDREILDKYIDLKNSCLTKWGKKS